MFNQELFPVPENSVAQENPPMQMYGNKEVALRKYLALGEGDTEKRNKSIRKMAPIMVDIFKLWDTVERELSFVNEKKHKELTFVQRSKFPISIFPDAPLKYVVPQSIILSYKKKFSVQKILFVQ